MATTICLSAKSLVTGSLLLLAAGGAIVYIVMRATDSGGDPPPPPFSAINSLTIEPAKVRPDIDALIAKFRSWQKADDVRYDVDKGSITVRDGSGHTESVDPEAVQNLLAELNEAEEVDGAPASLVPNVRTFYVQDGTPVPLDRSSVTVSWKFYITSNPDKAFSDSFTATDL
jgi:hypothetical protein